MRDARSSGDADVLLGEDWVAPEAEGDTEIRERRQKRGLITLNRSPLARKIITFNLLALIVLVAGVMYLNPGRDSLVQQHEDAFVTQAQLIARIVEAKLPDTEGVLLSGTSRNRADTAVTSLRLEEGIDAYLYDPAQNLISSTENAPHIPRSDQDRSGKSTIFTDFLNLVWSTMSGIVTPNAAREVALTAVSQTEGVVAKTVSSKATEFETLTDQDGHSVFAVGAPVMRDGKMLGVVALTSGGGEIDWLVRTERERVLQMFVIAILVSIGLSLVLASTIANPLSDLAAAAEIGRDKNARKMSPSRVRIPDLTARPDEIGRLSGALRGMVAALYDRIEGNEQFAADVAHEIKNPLASLRSAVGTLRVAKRDDQRDKLLDVIDHDVRRLDRLVSDISNASRLDSELVKEEEERFSMRQLLSNLSEHLSESARENGVDFISDLPSDPIEIQGLEARLAQVFVNLITNAISFCEEGDAVRVWARKRENRVLVVVEDTGPGIPEQALNKIFNRFYSERPVGQFGDHSGLGLAISKQIVEAHGGVIWSENIRPTDADITSEPLGARFVVGLPL